MAQQYVSWFRNLRMTDVNEVGKFDLAKLTAPHKGAVTYATTEFISEQDQPVEPPPDEQCQGGVDGSEHGSVDRGSVGAEAHALDRGRAMRRVVEHHRSAQRYFDRPAQLACCH